MAGALTDIRRQTLAIPGSLGSISIDQSIANVFSRNSAYDIINMNVGRNSNGYAFIHGAQRDYEYRVWDYEFHVSHEDRQQIEMIVRRYQLLQEALNLQAITWSAATTYNPAGVGAVGSIAYYDGGGNAADAGSYLYTGATSSAGNLPTDGNFWQRPFPTFEDRYTPVVDPGTRTRPLASSTTETVLTEGVEYFAKFFVGITNYRAELEKKIPKQPWKLTLRMESVFKGNPN